MKILWEEIYIQKINERKFKKFILKLQTLFTFQGLNNESLSPSQKSIFSLFRHLTIHSSFSQLLLQYLIQTIKHLVLEPSCTSQNAAVLVKFSNY